MADLGIEDDHMNKFKVIYTLNTLGQSTLLAVYQFIKPYNFQKNIKDHLIQDIGWSEARFKRKFDRTQITTIETTPNTGEKYDISLLVTCFRVLSEVHQPTRQDAWKDVNELEGRCKLLKDKRNSVLHAISGITIPEMRNQVDDIEQLMLNIMDSLKVHHPREARVIDDMKKDINERVAHIITHPLGKAELRTCHLQVFKDRIPLYRERCKEWGTFGILDFLMGCEKIHEVKLLFTEVIVEESKFRDPNTKVNYTDILKFDTNSILLIDSEAGGGKTTIFLYGISDWSEGSNTMNTSDYDLIFPMLFRNPHIKSVKELIKDLFHEASRDIDMDSIMEMIAEPSLKIAFFCDGFDEKNENSHQLFSEICELKRKYPHIRIICSSRPESVREFHYSIGKDHSIEHIKVLGIPEHARSSFLRKYHDEIIKAGFSKQSSNELIQFYESCSVRHKELYRLPINLVILAWIWGLNPEQAKTIKSAAGLYEAILAVLNEKLVSRIVESHPDVMKYVNGDIDELKSLIDRFKEILYNESLRAVRNDRIFIDEDGVKRLRDFCKQNRLPFLELKGAFLLSRNEWENSITLKEVLEFAHKGFLDYFSAKGIISELNLNVSISGVPVEARRDRVKHSKLEKLKRFFRKRDNRIEEIIVKTYGEDCQKFNISKYQNIIQIFGGLLALKSSLLVEDYGLDIIDLLIKTGINNNTQWYDIYSDLNINVVAAEKYAKLIAPHLNLNKLKITNSEVEILSSLLQYVEIDKVTLDITGDIMPDHLPLLIKVLNESKCKVSIKQINNDPLELWKCVLTPTSQIDLKSFDINKIGRFDISKLAIPDTLIKVLAYNKCKVTIPEINDKHMQLLPFLKFCSFERIKLCSLWRGLKIGQPDITGCDVEDLYTAVRSTSALPSTVTWLCLGLLTDASGDLVDPGLQDIRTRCRGLRSLGVHLRAGSKGGPALPKLDQRVQYTSLCLSQLSQNQDHDQEWAVQVASALQPPGGFWYLFLPSCGLPLGKLLTMVEGFKTNNIKITGGVCISSPHSAEDVATLEEALTRTLDCFLDWYQDDDELARERPLYW